MRPLTDHWPKPSLPFLNRPILHYALDTLHRAGIDRIGVNAFHLASRIQQTVAEWKSLHRDANVEVVVRIETRLMGTGGGARGVWDQMGRPPGPAVILNGDIVFSLDLATLLRSHGERGAAATLITSSEGEGGVFVEGAGSRVWGLPGPDGPAAIREGGEEVSFCGASIVESETLAALPEDPGCLLRSGLTPMLRQGLHVAFDMDIGRQSDVGTPERYRTATEQALDRMVEASGTGARLPAGTRIYEPVLIGDDVTIEGSAELGPYAVVGGRSRIGAGSRLSHGVLYDAELTGDVEHRFQVGAYGLDLPGPAETEPGL
jgi:mannose-1-phosphate guanylyltransferase/phosphomannomutase